MLYSGKEGERARGGGGSRGEREGELVSARPQTIQSPVNQRNHEGCQSARAPPRTTQTGNLRPRQWAAVGIVQGYPLSLQAAASLSLSSGQLGL